MSSHKTRLLSILKRDEIVSAGDLQKALDEQKRNGGNLTKILLKLNLIDEKTAAFVLSQVLEYPVVSVKNMRVSQDIIDMIPKEIAEKYKVLPMSQIGRHLTLVMADPLDIFVIDNIQSLTGCTVVPVISYVSDIDAGIQKYYEESGIDESDEVSEKKFDQIMQDIKGNDGIEIVREGAQTGDDIEELKQEAPIIRLVDTIIQQAVAAKASDIFIEPMEKMMRVRYRIDGVIREIDRMAKALNFPIVARIKVISNLDISEHRLPQDGRFKTIMAGNRDVDFRVSVLPTVFGEKVVMRILDQGGGASLNVDNVGFHPVSLDRLKEASIKPHGLILTCGPTGSGKTTTLYSVLNSVNEPGKNIVTVEDPVEFQLKGVNQVNVRPLMGLTFSASLRSILRQDPDIILIGEIRDKETMDIAVKAALTGHLVLSSLHTTTAAGSIIRMVNMGIEPFLICSTVLVVVAQRLLRKLCDKCKEQYEVPEDLIKKVELDPDKTYKLFKAGGCSKCSNTGYSGRVGISEVLKFTPEIKELVLEQASELAIKRKAIAEGMITMRKDALLKAEEGLTSLEEVVRITAPDSQ